MFENLLIENLFMDNEAPLFFKLMGQHWHQSKVDRSINGHQYFDWLQTEEGQGVVTVEGKQIILSPKEGILFSPNVPHEYHAITKNWKTSFFSFSGIIAREMVAYSGVERFRYFPKISLDLEHFIEENKELYQSDELLKRREQIIGIFSFLTLLAQNNNKDNDLYVQNIFKPITDFLSIHYTEAITNEQLAHLTGYSANYQTKLFKDYYGMTPLNYLNNFRIRKAKSLLIFEDNSSIQTISFQVGFPDVSHFIKIFKYETGYTPLQYRKNISL